METRQELEEEKSARESAKEKLSTTEAQLRLAFARVSKMDRQLRDADANITNLKGTIKSLEDQNRQIELQLETRTRHYKDVVKSAEVATSHVTQKRDALQSEVTDLKERKVEQQKVALNEALDNKQRTIEELQAHIYELEHKKKSSDRPTEREMDLWAELQATKDTLRITEEEISVCKKDTIRFLETMSKISESDNKIGIQQKLAAELLSKEEILSKMQLQLRELTKKIKLNEQKVILYEQYVTNFQGHNRIMGNEEEAPNVINYEELQQEVREELINMLKNKETEQSKDLIALQQDLEQRINIVNDVNKQIASKADEIQSLFSTLEKKQDQIHRLEKIVVAMEEQQRRAQAQRTRQEEKIAALEHELAAYNKNKERHLIFTKQIFYETTTDVMFGSVTRSYTP
ncbi:hypothetical protein ACJJTC_007769 [Scirpophaga incertulas]